MDLIPILIWKNYKRVLKLIITKIQTILTHQIILPFIKTMAKNYYNRMNILIKGSQPVMRTK